MVAADAVSLCISFKFKIIWICSTNFFGRRGKRVKIRGRKRKVWVF